MLRSSGILDITLYPPSQSLRYSSPVFLSMNPSSIPFCIFTLACCTSDAFENVWYKFLNFLFCDLFLKPLFNALGALIIVAKPPPDSAPNFADSTICSAHCLRPSVVVQSGTSKTSFSYTALKNLLFKSSVIDCCASVAASVTIPPATCNTPALSFAFILFLIAKSIIS